MNRIFVNLVLILLLSVPLASIAETTRYVSDELEITMRNGKGIEFAIRKMLLSGTKLDVIEIDPAGYSKVRTSKGVEGWVLTRFLSTSPSSRDSLTSSEQNLINIELELSKYKEEIQALASQNTDAGSENITLKETSQRLSKELDDLRKTAANAVAINDDNRQLQEKLQQIDHDMQLLVIENSYLKDSDAKSWFSVGAAVLFSGLILGIFLPRFRLQKKDSWGGNF